MEIRNVSRFESPAEMSVAALSAMASYSMATIRARGRVNIAISGGSSPLGLFSLLGRPGNKDLLQWEDVHFFWVDERFLPVYDEESNYGMARDTFLGNIEITKSNVHPIDTRLETPDKAAAAYREELKKHFGEKFPVFDLIMLGMGADGHTASLFPHSKALNEKAFPVVAVPPPVSSSPKVPRITMTLPVINKAKKVYIITSGAEKQHVTDYILEGKHKEVKYPVQMINNNNIDWYISKQ